MDAVHVPGCRRLMWSAPCARVATIHEFALFHAQGKYDPLRMLFGRVIERRLARNGLESLLSELSSPNPQVPSP